MYAAKTIIFRAAETLEDRCGRDVTLSTWVHSGEGSALRDTF